ncbi:MAG: cyclic nucleotide-binding domain-containing protein, partial [Bacteroidia bacterium]|nr:cyclic nucleotide-binding domain-containing protein [Bacteroidia bacterium]
MHPFHQFIQLYTPLSDADWALVEPCLEKKQFMTGDLILAEGKICRHLYFLESGLLRFFVWKEGRDVTKYFTDIPYTFTSQKSFTTRQPAKESIEALEDSVVWQMPYEDA